MLVACAQAQTGLGIYGGAQTASPRYLCSWWNPALLAGLRQKSVALGVGYRPLGRTEGYVGFEFSVPPRVGLGLSVLYRGIPVIKGLVDEQEYPLDECAFETFSFKVGIAYLIRRNLFAGLNLSVLYQSLPTGFEDLQGASNIIYSSATEIGGLDLGLYYVPSKKLCYGLVVKNLLGSFKWEFTDANFSPIYEDALPATVTLGQQLSASLLGWPFIWSTDIIAYVLDSRFTSLDRNHIVINNGFEWQRWELFFVRAGIRDIALNSDMFRHSGAYADHFTCVASAGFRLDLSTALKGRGVVLNYAFATDKIGAGLEQQLDFVFSF